MSSKGRKKGKKQHENLDPPCVIEDILRKGSIKKKGHSLIEKIRLLIYKIRLLKKIPNTRKQKQKQSLRQKNKW